MSEQFVKKDKDTMTTVKLQDITNKTVLPMSTSKTSMKSMTTTTTMASISISKEGAVGTANNGCDTKNAATKTEELQSMVSQSAVVNIGTRGVSGVSGVSGNTTQDSKNRLPPHNMNNQKSKPKPKNRNKDKKNKKNKGNNNNNNNNVMDGNSILLDNDNDELDYDLIGIPLSIRSLMEVQPTLNIMTIGSVSHGKSTLMWGLCDEKTGRDSREIKNNMTIKLGYTSCKIYKCINCRNVNNMCYFSENSSKNSKKVECPRCNIKAPFVILVRHISFVDCPGHAQYMGTMISAACVADGAVMVIDASKPFPSQQTVQHTSAAHLLGVLTDNVDDRERLKSAAQMNEDTESKNDDANNNKNDERIKVIVAQNKIDLIDRQKACRNVEEIRSFLAKYDKKLSQDTPVIPISAQSKLNLDALCMTMVKKYPKFSPRLLEKHSNKVSSVVNGSIPRPIPDPVITTQSGGINNDNNDSIGELGVISEEKRNMKWHDNSLQINVIRSFDVNRPCEFKKISDIDKLFQGGVLGGVIINGTISVGDSVCIRPGIVRIRSNYKAITDSAVASKMSVAKKIKHHLLPKYEYQAIEAKVIGLKCGTKKLQAVHPGANVGIMLNIDPCLTKSDQRVGDVVCSPNEMDCNNLPVFNVFAMSYVLLKPFDRDGFGLLEAIKVNIGSSKIDGLIVEKKYELRNKCSNGVLIVLKRPICAKLASQVTITRKIRGEWRLAAGGIIVRVRECTPTKV